MRSDAETFAFFDQDCADLWDQKLDKLQADDAARNLFFINMDLIIANACINNLAYNLLNPNPNGVNPTLDNIENMKCGKGDFLLINYYYGACARNCLGIKKFEGQKYKLQIFRNRIVCAFTCCLSQNKFCYKTKSGENIPEAVGLPLYATITGCEQSGSNHITPEECGGSNPDPKITWKLTSKCISACDISSIGRFVAKENIIDKSYEQPLNVATENGELNIRVVEDTKTLYLFFDESFEGEVGLLDLNGKTIINKSNTAYDKSVELNTSDLPKGVYFLKLQSKNKIMTRKIIIH